MIYLSGHVGMVGGGDVMTGIHSARFAHRLGGAIQPKETRIPVATLGWLPYLPCDIMVDTEYMRVEAREGDYYIVTRNVRVDVDEEGATP